MTIDIPTILLALIVESLVMFLAAALLLHRSSRNRQGAFWLTGSIGMMMLTLTVIALHENLPGWLPPSSACAFAILTMAMLTLAVTKFQKMHLSAVAVYAPVVAAGVTHVFLGGRPSEHIIFTGAIMLCQESFVLLRILHTRHTTSGIGKYMILLGLAINALALIAGMLRCLPADMLPLPEATLFSQGVLFLTVFPTLNLVGLGYLLMEREAEDERFRQLALRDNLTQCWNRNYFEIAARHEMERLARHGTPVSLIMLDIDLFKTINDRFGHAIGDEILREFSATTQTCIRSSDILARWGGEEFIILLPASGQTVTAGIAERIRAAFARANFANTDATVSAGYACCKPGESWDEWFHRADTALYEAKALGRNRVAPASCADRRGTVTTMQPRLA